MDRIVCLGDVVGYGPQPCACLDQAIEFDFCVLGNHDSSALFDPEGFNVAAEQAIFWTRAQLECGRDGPEASRRRMEFLCKLPRTVREGECCSCTDRRAAPPTSTSFPKTLKMAKKWKSCFP
ncbi:metallophosphoesterase [Rhodopirellula maiorica SM1]|uniref:Metallophosphoesterase n=1 Tax=Rhodopirellula maiorica SM1 TaxID=1265738 RepID=M5RQ26_9BACT|nr:metallophosphoesterase [Rhodopirellula maiorica SM1]